MEEIEGGLKKCKSNQVRNPRTKRCKKRSRRTVRRHSRLKKYETMSNKKLLAHLRKLERSGKMAQRQRIIEHELSRHYKHLG